VTLALREGFTGIDTANQPLHYNEAAVGAALRAHDADRHGLWVQTKFTFHTGQDPANCPYDPALPPAQQLLASFASSLLHLGCAAPLPTQTQRCVRVSDPQLCPCAVRTTWTRCCCTHRPAAAVS
jgi:aryl-alcohol dehydrogenase-like predicted oxidoreductase